MTTTLANLTNEILRNERDQAAGSETALWSLFVERMRELTGLSVRTLDGEEPATIEAAEVAWWRAAYSIQAAHSALIAKLSADGPADVAPLDDILAIGIDRVIAGEDAAAVVEGFRF